VAFAPGAAHSSAMILGQPVVQRTSSARGEQLALEQQIVAAVVGG
jgi:hypothetical protein